MLPFFRNPFFQLILSICVLSSCAQKGQPDAGEQEEYDGPAEIAAMEFEKTKDPATGTVPRERLLNALMYTDSVKALLPFQVMAGYGNWTERGPISDVVGSSNGNTRANNGVAAGRIRAILVDAADATGKTVFVGAVDGGLWKTTNITSNPANWTLINDFFTNMAITSICQDPTNPSIMYFGTGEGFYNSDAVRGMGVWKSTDGGANWTQLSSTTNLLRCTKIVCDASGNIYLGDRNTGLLRSTDGGSTWTNITPAGAGGILTVADIEISSTGRLHVTIGLAFNTTAFYFYTNNPSTTNTTTSAGNWVLPTTAFPTTTTNRVELGCSGNTLYALPSNSSTNVVNTIYRSTDGGDTWSATATTPAFSSGQGWYCLAVDIDPSNSNNVIVGSLDCFKSTNGGTSWSQVSTWVGTTPVNQYVHADQQIMLWYDNGNKLLVGSDGGIHYSSDKGASFSDRNYGLRIKQFYSVAMHPSTTNYFLAGAQDNGSHQFNSAGLGSTVEVTGGDGAFVHIDQNEPQFQFTSYVYNQYRRSINSGASWTTVNLSSSAGQFINPTDYDDAANIMYCSNTAGTFRRWTNPQTGAANVIISIPELNASSILAVKVSPYTSNRVYFGTAGGRVVAVDNANTITSGSAGSNLSTGLPPAAVSCIEVGTNDNNLICSFSNYGVQSVWVSTDGGSSWTSIDGNLPDMPVRWCMFVPGDNSRAIIATEAGVYLTHQVNGSSTVWIPSPTFPTVRTDMLQYRASDGVIAAATHGRGLWTQPYLSIVPANKFLLRGRWNGNKADLQWEFSTGSSAVLDIEMSTDGNQFNKMGSVNSGSSKFYNYLHIPGYDKVYYRIKSREANGIIKYSNTIRLFRNGASDEIQITSLFPNPVPTELSVGFVAAKGRMIYTITSLRGQQVWRKEEYLDFPGGYLRKWNIASIPPGNYLMTLSNGKVRKTQKFIKK